MSSNLKFDAAAKEWFLIEYAASGNNAHACRTVGISPRTVRTHRNTDEQFAALYQYARDEAADSLEAEAIRRARDGVQKKIYHQGVCVDVVTEYSDSLLQFLLRGLKPDVYGQKQQITVDARDKPPPRVHNDSDRSRLLTLVGGTEVK